MDTETKQPSRQIAAIDLGSNSFHMVIAKVVGDDLQVVSRHKQRVRLAAGLNSEQILDKQSMQRGLDCLAMFAERLDSFELEDVRIAATHTLRQATNASTFIEQAYQVLPFPIEIISGTEEARLIYLGVAHTQPESNSKLVIDIGGGSTEMIIGEEFEPQLLNSKQMGCVNFTKKFFGNGKINKDAFLKAELAVKQHLSPIIETYKKRGWHSALGASGTVKAIREVLIAKDNDNGIITTKKLTFLIDQLCTFKLIDDIKLQGLTEQRRPVFAAGVAILNAIFNELNIDQLHFSDGALREGLLYEMEDRFKRSDIRMRTTESLAKKHNVDLKHAEKVCIKSKQLFELITSKSALKKEKHLLELLGWGAMLHEVGLSINYQAFHRHSAYILQYTNMPGFNQEQQLVLSTLARFQRKAIRINELPTFTQFKKKQIIKMIKILRLAILLNSQRSEQLQPVVSIYIDEAEQWVIKSEQANWLETNKLLEANLINERNYWTRCDWHLIF